MLTGDTIMKQVESGVNYNIEGIWRRIGAIGGFTRGYIYGPVCVFIDVAKKKWQIRITVDPNNTWKQGTAIVGDDCGAPYPVTSYGAPLDDTILGLDHSFLIACSEGTHVTGPWVDTVNKMFESLAHRIKVKYEEEFRRHIEVKAEEDRRKREKLQKVIKAWEHIEE